MILKGNQRANGRELALHLLNVEDNEHAVLHELRGFIADDLIGAFKEAEAISLGTKCHQYLFSLSLSPPQSASVSILDFEKAIADIELHLGLSDQPRAIVVHEKKGRRHAHCIWSRIDVDGMRAINLPHYKLRLMDVSRALYLEHGWEMPPGLQNSDDADLSSYSHAEAGQTNRAKRDPAALKTIFRNCWETSDSRHSFSAALREQGFYLARGDRRAFVAVDAGGEVYSLSRWCGVKAKELCSRFGEPDSLPLLEDAQALALGSSGLKRSDLPYTGPDEVAKSLARDLAELVRRQREERKALATKQAWRRVEEIKARSGSMPTGLKAVWVRLTGQQGRICEELEQAAKACEARDPHETQALIDRHLAERRALKRELTTPNILRELERTFRGAAQNGRRRVYQPDPLQPLLLPPDDTPFTNAEVRAVPERILDVLSDKQERFTRAEIVTRLADVFDDPLTLSAAIDSVFASDNLILLPATNPLAFTTLDYESARNSLAAISRQLAHARAFYVGVHNVENALAKENASLQGRFGARLSNEQVEAIRHLLQPSRFSAVVGLAGTGKSTLLSVARQAWESQGYRVHGAALAGKAADSLQTASGIPSRTLASLEASWKAGYEPIGHGEILVIDEAGMVGTRQLQRVAKALHDRGCKLVLVGDPSQLQPIEAGTPFKDIVENVGGARLTEIRRQDSFWQREASRLMASGEIDRGLQAYAGRGAVRTEDNRDCAIAALVEDYLADRNADGEAVSRLALAHRRKDVHAINQAIKTGLREREGAKTESLFDTVHGPRAFAEGDRLLFTRNDADLDVRNGMVGIVLKIDNDTLTIRLDPDEKGESRKVSFSPRLFPSIDHGFAVSIHRSQGCTVDRSFILSSRTLDEHLTYVAMTRHREAATFYTAHEIKHGASLPGLEREKFIKSTPAISSIKFS